MCFFNRKQYLRYAVKDIKCVKVMNFDDLKDGIVLHSLLFNRHHSFNIGDTIKAAKKLSTNKLANALKISRTRVLQDEVVHSHDMRWLKNHRDYDKYFYGTALVECVIPKGTFYWHNSYHQEYASPCVKLVKIIYVDRNLCA